MRSIFNAFFQLTACIMFIILLPTAAPTTQSAHYVFTSWQTVPDFLLPNNVYASLWDLLCPLRCSRLSAAPKGADMACAPR